jgi:hypothetical protein
MTTLQRIGLGLLVMLMAFLVGDWHGSHKAARPVIQPPAAAVRQADGSLVIARNPDQPRPKTPRIPPGSTVTRVTTIQIKPKIAPENGAIPVQSIELTQVRTADGGTRVIASSEDGKIIGGADWTIPAPEPPRIPRWSLQAVRAWQPGRPASWGASVAYSRGPMVGSVTAIPGMRAVQVGIGFRW